MLRCLKGRSDEFCVRSLAWLHFNSNSCCKILSTYLLWLKCILRVNHLAEAESSSSWNLQALGKIMLQLQHLCQGTVPVFLYMREKKGHAVTRNMIAIVLRMRKSLTTFHLRSHVWLAAPPSKEGFLTHRLSPVSGTAGGALLPRNSLQILISSPSTLLKPKLQSSNQIGLMEVGCMLFWEVVCSLPSANTIWKMNCT